MLLSIVIVSYEVKYFLEQCLFSVEAAINRLESKYGKNCTEIVVVDNASTDGSVDYLMQFFPSVNFIRSKANVGFGRANNHALQAVHGKYVLFLNPDTIVPEEILETCVSFLESHPSVGGLGVKMIDGSGQFLAESKRGFPTPWRSFCKLSGLSALLSNSRFFAGYNLGHVYPEQVVGVEVLAGAFMMIRGPLVKQLGGFDERFFMYAEDIDLSKRIMDAGYINYYLGNCCIVHFKGESTRKDKLYVKRFYEAMNLYVKKHYTGFGSGVAVGFMKAAISLRSMMAGWQVNSKILLNGKISSVRFIGDQNSISFLRRAWAGVKEDDEADTIVLCQGKDFSFASLIQTIQRLPKSSKLMVHASGSQSVVGSFSSQSQGVTESFTSA